MTLFLHKKSAAFTLLLLLVLLSAKSTWASSDIYVAQPFNDTLLCVGGTFNVNVITTKRYTDPLHPSNEFWVMLSDASGSFSTSTIIGRAPADTSVGVFCRLPAGTTTGNTYRIRVVSTGIKDTSVDNGKNIRISEYPTFTLSENSPLCEGGQLRLTTTTTYSPATYSWTGPGIFSSALQNPVRNGITINDSGYYKLRMTYYGCATTDSINVRVIKAPANAQIRTNSPVCAGDVLTIFSDNASAGWTYDWYRPNGTIVSKLPNVIISDARLTDDGKYRVVLNASGCIVNDSVVVKVKPRPDTPDVTSNSPICLGDTLKLFAISATPGTTYQWSGPAGFSAASASATIPNADYTRKGVYTCSVSLNGCAVAGYDTVEIGAPLGKPEITGTALVCPGDSIMLTAKGTAPGGDFEWTLPDGSKYTVNPFALYKAQPIHSGGYVVVQKLNGCTSEPDTFNVTIPELPELKAGSNSPVCSGQQLLLNTTTISGARYEWAGPGYATNMQNPVIENAGVNRSGKYVVKAFIGTCVKTAETEVVVNALPVIKNVSGNTPVCEAATLELTAEADATGATYKWTGPGGYMAEGQTAKRKMGFADAGYYYVTATAKACTSLRDSIKVEVKERAAMPEAFSNSPLMQGDTLYLGATCSTPGVTYSWTGPDGFYSEKQNDTIYGVVPAQRGSYIVNAHYNGCITSAIIIVNIDGLGKSVFVLYPNPNNGNFTLRADLATDDKVAYEIINSLGRIIAEGAFESKNRHFKHDISVDAASGVYMLRMRIGRTERVLQFTIVK